MAKTPTLAQQWERFAEAVMPANVSTTQYQEMRRSFYGGVAMMLEIMDIIAGDEVSEDDGVMILELVHREKDRFYQLVKMGRA